MPVPILIHFISQMAVRQWPFSVEKLCRGRAHVFTPIIENEEYCYVCCIVGICSVQGSMESRGLSHRDWSCSGGSVDV